MTTEHYKKKIGRQTRNRLLKLLQNHPKGLNTGRLRNELRISMPVLSTHLKTLEKDGKIENFRDPNKDRRFQWYRINPDRKEEVLTELSMYDAIRFIMNMPRLAYHGLKPKKGKQSIAAFASVPATVNRKKWIEDWKKRIDRASKMPKLPGVRKGEKMAIVIMVEGK